MVRISFALLIKPSQLLTLIMAKDGKVNDPVTYKIIGCAMTVHNELGNGFQEVIYQRSLSYEMENYRD